MAHPSKPWADGPFKLISTPESLQDLKQPVDQYVKTASLMAVAHNSILRGLNSIYLQAPHVKKEEYKDFIGYSLSWHQVIDSHHRSEEDYLFPQIEAITGEKGIMEINVEQHHSFNAGVKTYYTYLQSLAGHEADFSASRLIAIIDSFSATLQQHLADEIPTLLELRRFSSASDGNATGGARKKLPLLDLMQTISRKSGAMMPKTEGSMMFFLNLDLTFEDGRWKGWPPIPWLVRRIIFRVLAGWNSGWWKFASCDLYGNPKELYALGS